MLGWGRCFAIPFWCCSRLGVFLGVPVMFIFGLWSFTFSLLAFEFLATSSLQTSPFSDTCGLFAVSSLFSLSITTSVILYPTHPST